MKSRDPLRPVFVIGNPRSGTSLLRLMLTCHPDLVVPPECGFILWLHPKHGEWTGQQSGDPVAAAHFVDDLLACRKFDTWNLESDTLNAAITRDLPADYASLCACVVYTYAAAQGRSPRFWGDKNNFHIAHIGDLHRIYPSARFLHITRDGRDVACSYRSVMSQGSESRYAPRLNTSAEDIAREWTSNIEAAESALATLPSEQRMTMSYEALTSEPGPTLQRICSWLGIPFDTRMLDFHEVNRTRQLEPASTMDWKARTTSPVSSDTVGQFRRVLGADDIRAFESVAGPTLQKLGYPLHDADAAEGHRTP